MNKILCSICFVVFMVACASSPAPQTPNTDTANAATIKYASDSTIEEGKGVLIQQSVKIQATVVSVDKADRSISVRDSAGKIQKIELTKEVKNFDKIHPGNEVVLDVYSSIAMQLAKPGQEFDDSSAAMVKVAAPGEKPKYVNVDVVDVLAEISKIDKEKREVTVQGPVGKPITVIVPDRIKKFDELKIGEKVNTRYIKAFALSVETVN